MLELVVSVCLIGDPEICKDQHLQVAMDEGRTAQCASEAPPLIARWIDAHPKWKVVRWHCEAPRDRGHEI